MKEHTAKQIFRTTMKLKVVLRIQSERWQTI